MDVQLPPGPFRLADGERPQRVLPPQTDEIIGLEFTPPEEGAFEAMLTLGLSNLADPRRAIKLRGRGQRHLPRVVPRQLDFGRRGPGCGHVARDLFIQAGNSAGEFLPADTRGHNGAELQQLRTSTPLVRTSILPPIQLPHRRSLQTRVDVVVPQAGALTEDLVLSFIGIGGHSADIVVPVQAYVGEAPQADYFHLSETLDLLFIIDDSSSYMGQRVSQQAEILIGGLQRLGVDYHIAVTSTERGSSAGPFKLVSSTGRHFLNPELTVDPVHAFREMSSVGGRGGSEIVLDATYAALGSQLVETTNAGFRRPHADLLMVPVTDEREQSQAPVDFFARFFTSMTEDLNQLAVYPIDGGDQGSSCAEAAPRLGDFGRRFRFSRGRLCDADFHDNMDRLVEDLIARLSSVALSQRPQPSSLEVFVEDERLRGPGEPGPRAWSFDSGTQRILFPAFSAPRRGEMVEVRYEAICEEQ